MNDDNQQKAVFVDEKTQNELNTPLKRPELIDDEERAFLENVIKLIQEGKIVLWNPDTLINQPVYDQLPKEKQGKIDFEAVNLLSVIREIKGLHDVGYVDTYQMNNLVERLKATKERIEHEGGDLFII